MRSPVLDREFFHEVYEKETSTGRSRSQDSFLEACIYRRTRGLVKQKIEEERRVASQEAAFDPRSQALPGTALSGRLRLHFARARQRLTGSALPGGARER